MEEQKFELSLEDPDCYDEPEEKNAKEMDEHMTKVNPTLLFQLLSVLYNICNF